jgi:catechol 2,3-dioxygenase-like lactoylglutathione lyase family enzyme
MPYSLTISHVGLYVKDVAAMVDFYTRVLGFAVSDRGMRPAGEIAFLTRDPHDHHQFVIASGRPDDVNFNVINQISFRVDSLATLKELHGGLQGEAVKDITTLTHGNALSCYFRDPEYNRIEVFIDTPWYVPQPHHLDLDLTMPDDQLWALIEKHVRAMPGFRPVAEWTADMERRIAQATASRKTARRAASPA